MHHYTGQSVSFNVNGDFSGLVEIIVYGKEAKDTVRVDVPFTDLKMLVGEYLRNKKINELENASTDELLP